MGRVLVEEEERVAQLEEEEGPECLAEVAETEGRAGGGRGGHAIAQRVDGGPGLRGNPARVAARALGRPEGAYPSLPTPGPGWRKARGGRTVGAEPRGAPGPAEARELGAFEGPGLRPDLGGIPPGELAQEVAQGLGDGAARGVGILEAHFALGRVDVEIGEGRVDLEEEEGAGVGASRQEAFEAVLEGLEEGPLLHPAAVDEGLHEAAVGPVEGRPGEDDFALEARPREADGVEELARRLAQAVRDAAGALGREEDLGLGGAGLEGEADARMGEGLVDEDLAAEGGLGLGPLEELAPGGEVGEEPRDGHGRALAPRAGRDRGRGAGARDQALRRGRGRVAAQDLHAGRGGYGSQGLAAEAEAPGPQEVVGRGYLRGRVRQDREREVLGVHARAVVREADEADAPLLDADGYLPRPRVDGVVEELAEGRGRAIDDLSRGDEPGDGGRQDLDDAHEDFIPAPAPSYKRPGDSESAVGPT